MRTLFSTFANIKRKLLVVYINSLNIWRKYVENETKSCGLTIVQYNEQMDVFIVKSPIREDGRGNNVYAVNFRDQSCTCNKWSVFGIPCSHAFAVCQHMV